MQNRPKRTWFSLAALGLGNRAYVVFILGSVVPLAFLALITNRYVLPQLGDLQATATVAAVVLVALLAILSFIVLVRTTTETVQRLNGYNERLAILLESARFFGETRFVDLIAERAARASADLTAAPVAYAFIEGSDAQAASREPVTFGEAAARILTCRRQALRALAAAACQDQQTLVLDRHSPPLIQDLLGKAQDGFDLSAVLATPLMAHGRSFGAILVLRLAPAVAFETEDAEVILTLARQAAVALDGARLKEAEQNFFTHVTEILVQTLDLNVDHQEGHSRRVAHYATQIGRELAFDAARLQRLFFASLLHDIGMLRIDRRQAADRAAFREHCRLADEMLRPITLWSDVAAVVRHHHERHDGTGYPDGLAGDRIPLESRIISLADTFDVLTAPSSYRPTVEAQEAIREIERCAGGQFDPEVVKAFLALARRGEIEPAG